MPKRETAWGAVIRIMEELYFASATEEQKQEYARLSRPEKNEVLGKFLEEQTRNPSPKMRAWLEETSQMSEELGVPPESLSDIWDQLPDLPDWPK